MPLFWIWSVEIGEMWLLLSLDSCPNQNKVFQIKLRSTASVSLVSSLWLCRDRLILSPRLGPFGYSHSSLEHPPCETFLPRLCFHTRPKSTHWSQRVRGQCCVPLGLFDNTAFRMWEYVSVVDWFWTLNRTLDQNNPTSFFLSEDKINK